MSALAKARALHLEDPETLLALCGICCERVTRRPRRCATRQSFSTASSRVPRREIGLFDERDYFSGETALLAGAACR